MTIGSLRSDRTATQGFKEDGFFVVGRSDAKKDWPYVHPGPEDGWAGGRQHSFTVLFGVAAAPEAGECKLLVDLVDTQGRTPPELRIEINGKAFKKRMPGGGGDDSVFGKPSAGKEHRFEYRLSRQLITGWGERGCHHDAFGQLDFI